MKKKVLNIVLYTLLTIIFVVSTLFNILAFSTSYGSLMFKYDKNLYSAMHQDSVSKLAFNNNKEQGIQIEGKNIAGCSSFEAQYHMNNDLTIDMKSVCKTKEGTTTYYVKGDTIYIQEGKTKTKEAGDIGDFITKYPDFYEFASIAIDNDLLENKNKTSMDFSFSPFYTFGIKYSYKTSDSEKITYKYDLKGNLRKVEYEKGKEKSFATISYKNKKIEFPTLSLYK